MKDELTAMAARSLQARAIKKHGLEYYKKNGTKLQNKLKKKLGKAGYSERMKKIRAGKSPR